MFGIMIFVHELGHYLAARACGVKVLEFAVGMGPALIRWKSKKTDIQYSIRLLPIGGFTSMLGEDEEVYEEKKEAPEGEEAENKPQTAEQAPLEEAAASVKDPRALSSRPAWQRLIVLLAGSFMNILTGMIAMFMVVCMAPGYNNTTVAGFDGKDGKYYREASISESYQAGLRRGDEVLKINGSGVSGWTDIVNTISLDGTKPVDITVRRGGEVLVIEDVQFPVDSQDGVSFGVVDFVTEYNEYGFGARLGQTVERSFATVKTIYKSLVKLVVGDFGLQGVSGPVGTVSTIGQAVTSPEVSSFRVEYLFYLFSFISMNLGVMNLLPLPALDGGRILFVLLEMLRGKPVARKYEGWIHLAGMALLLGFMALITVVDVMKLFR